MIIPSIDIMGGKAVQLKQGREKVLERGDVLELAKEFNKYGELAVIDLDAALDKGDNTELIKRICKVADCRVGGGIRTVGKARELLKAGAKKIIIGTKASKQFLKGLPKENVIVAIDTRNGLVTGQGWTKSSSKKPEQVIEELEDYCSEFLFTNIDKEGLMQGFDYKKAIELKNLTANRLTAAGGITSTGDIRKLEDIGVNSQLGMSLYKGKIDLKETVVSLLRIKDLVPTIVQDTRGQVLMLAYSNAESISRSFETNRASYYSRSRGKLWVKGDTSGNFQELVKVRYDCDRDTLLFTVKQENVACHTDTYSCFGEKAFCLEDLYDVLKDRIADPRQGSYTSSLSLDEIKSKIGEEATELVNFTDKSNLIWEIADLTYFVMVLMAKEGVTLSDIQNELRGRRK